MTDCMATINLPPNVQARHRKGYIDYYYIVHPRTRAKGWPANIKLGTSKDDQTTLYAYAWRTHLDYVDYKNGVSRSHEGSLHDCCDKYEKSPYYTDLSKRTQRDYADYFKEIKKWSLEKGHAHVKYIQPKHIVKWLSQWDSKPVKQRRAKTVLSLVMNAAIREGFINTNPIREVTLQRRKTKKRPIQIWTERDIDTFVNECDERGLYSLGSIALTMIETAQRKGDVVNMVTGKSYKDGRLSYVQSKTGKTVWMPATKKLRERLDKFTSNDYYMFIRESTGKQWRDDAVTHMARAILDSLGMKKHIVQHLRHSQVNYLYEHGCTDNEITAFTGHEKPETMREFYREKVNETMAEKVVNLIDERRGTNKNTN